MPRRFRVKQRNGLVLVETEDIFTPADFRTRKKQSFNAIILCINCTLCFNQSIFYPVLELGPPKIQHDHSKNHKIITEFKMNEEGQKVKVLYKST